MDTLIPTNDRLVVQEDWIASSDEKLVSAAKDGDLAAFNTLCERYTPRTLRKIYSITKDWEDAEDALQDALLKAFTHLKTFEGRCRFSSWFTRIAINSSLMILRKRKVRREISLDDDGNDAEAWQLPDPRAKSPETLFVQSETRELIRLALCIWGPDFGKSSNSGSFTGTPPSSFPRNWALPWLPQSHGCRERELCFANPRGWKSRAVSAPEASRLPFAPACMAL
jgi:RNA polymerase sigma factor (sigma-70 family)